MRQKILTVSLLLATSVSAFAGKGPLDQSMTDSWVHVPGHYDMQYPSLSKAYYPSALEPMLGKTTSPQMTCEQKFDFADLAYKAEKSDSTIFDKMVTQLNTEGWSVQRLKGTTGTALSQAASTMGLIAFRGKEVVISFRGTRMTSRNDWTTDVRFDRDLLGKFLGILTGNQVSNLKDDIIGAQFLGVEGKVHNGFLQTYLSMKPQIRQAILDRAKKLDCQVSDLTFKTVGHSLGAALQDLLIADILNDPQFGIGTKILEASFVDTQVAQELDQSGFHVIKKTEKVENTNLQGLNIEGPGVFDKKGADQLNQQIGKGNLNHLENAGDLIPHAAGLVGLAKIGEVVSVDGGGAPVVAHCLGNVKKAAVELLDNQNATPQEKSIPRRVSDAVVGAGQSVINAGRTVVNAGRSVVNAISDGISEVANTIWNAWVSW